MTPNKEDFIKAIFQLKGDTDVVSNKKLVEALGVSAASVTDMNSRLLKENLIVHTPYQGVQLTETGLTVANQLIRKHRLWEVFLAECLGYNWNEVHSDADLLEHASSDFLIERLDAFLGFPKIDPHGDLIPKQNGVIERKERSPLAEVEVGDKVVIKKVYDQNEFLEYLSSKGIQLGNVYEIANIEPFEGPITLKNKDGNITLISYKAAFRIFIEYRD